jgi:hypothetical protein
LRVVVGVVVRVPVADLQVVVVLAVCVPALV